jgi:transcriptional antiterminator
MRREMNIMAMAKGSERYVFLYDDQSRDALIQVFERFAENAELNFSRRDAEILTQKVRETVERRFTRRFPSYRGL